MKNAQLLDGDLESAEILKKIHSAVLAELSKRIVGQQEVIDQLLVTLFASGHCLLVGVPGLAKTLLVSSLAEILALKFNRIQFTPDLLPSDITGTDIIEEDQFTRKRSFRFIQGPIFSNILLADEINRTPPKTQAALLQAMQENQVTAGGKTYPLEQPFCVLATQNPIEQEGTYPLPEAQLDRFMLSIELDYPTYDEEKQIVMTTTSAETPTLEQIVSNNEILRAQEVVRKVIVAEPIVEYAVTLCRSSRPNDRLAPDFIKNFVSWGAGPRASQYLILSAKVLAIMQGRYHATYEDVRSMAKSVLRHRILTNFNAEAEGINSSQLIDRLLKANSR